MKSQLIKISMQKVVAKAKAPIVANPMKEKLPKIVSCLAYGFVSVSITLFNKTIFSVYGFHYPAFVTLVQVVLSVFFMALLARARVIDFEVRAGRRGILGLKWFTAKKVFPLAFFWMLYVQPGKRTASLFRKRRIPPARSLSSSTASAR